MIETVIVGEAVAGEAAKTKKRIETLLKGLKQSSFDLAETLHKIRANGWYRPDFDTFTDYLKSLESGLDVQKQTLKYLEHIADVMEQVGIERNIYEPIGISKLREITSLDPKGTWTSPKTGETYPLKDFIVDFVEKAESMDYNDLKQQVKTLKGFVGEHDIENRTFGWTKETIEKTIDPAIELARRNIGSVARDKETGEAIDASPSRCVEMWAVEFLTNPANNILEE